MKRGLLSITPAKFYILANNTEEYGDDIDFDTSTKSDNDIVTIENSEGCNSKPVLNADQVAGIAGVNEKTDIEPLPVTIIAYHKKVRL